MARRPTAQRIREAYDLLGLQPGTATQADARRAYRRKAKEVHPDHHPDDPQAKAKFQALTDALEIVLSHIRTGGRLATEPDTEAPKRAGPRTTIWEVQAPAGSGKTTRWAAAMMRETGPGEGMVRRGGFQWPPGYPRHMIYAGPTIKLLEEVRLALAKHGVKAHIIHSESPGSGLVNTKLAMLFRSILPNDDAVVLISHAALLNLPNRLEVPSRKPTEPPSVVFDRERWDLVVDEAPEILTFYSESWPLTHHIVSNRVLALDFSRDLYRLTPTTTEAETFLKMLGGNVPLDTNIGDGTRAICQALCDPQRMVLVNRAQWDDLAYRDPNTGRGLSPYAMLYGGALDVMVIYTPGIFMGYRSTTVMGARLDTTLYHVVWNKLWNMEFRQHPLQQQLPPLHTNGKRLRLWYMAQEPATRELLARKSNTGETMLRAFAQRVAAFFNPSSGPKPRNRQFIWSAPLDRGSPVGVKDTFFRDLRLSAKEKASSRPTARPFDADLRLSGKSMGQNRYMRYHAAVLLNVVNFSPNEWAMLHSIGLTDPEIYRALAHNVAYQDLLRCSLRVPSVRDIVNAIVIDRATALDIGGEFPGCQMRELPDAPQRAAKKRAGRKKVDSRTTKEQTRDRQRSFRARQREAKARAKERERE